AYGALIVVAATLGATVAARHVYLQSLPADQVPACGPGLEFMLDTFPLQETLALILRGSGECAEVDWTLLGLSMPAWSLLWLIALALLGAAIVARR
ncbi:MAG: disulfide bond formation protein B, partial [bacterium]